MDPRQLRLTLALANPFKEGDAAVGGTADQRLRSEARRALLAITISDLRQTAIVDDDVTASLLAGHHRAATGALDAATIGQIKAALLGAHADAWTRRHRDGLSSEAIAAVVKVMTEDELSRVARAASSTRCLVTACRLGAPQHFGSRIQPNSPGDDEDEILFSILEGLAYGCGDVIIGLNPASDDVETIVRLEELLRTRRRAAAICRRATACSRTSSSRRGARGRTRVDVGFQSLAGTSKALAGMVGLDVDGISISRAASTACYFETGQGSAVTNGAAEGVDMVTLEARAYGVARYIAAQADAARGRSSTTSPASSDPKCSDRRATAARVPGRHGDGQAARPHDGARRLRDVSHGHRPGGACSAPHGADRRARRAGVSDGGGRATPIRCSAISRRRSASIRGFARQPAGA